MTKKYISIADKIIKNVNDTHCGMREISESERGHFSTTRKHWYYVNYISYRFNKPEYFPLCGVDGIEVVNYGKNDCIIARNYFDDNFDSGICYLSDYHCLKDTIIDFIDGTASCTRTSIKLKKGDCFTLKYGTLRCGGARAYITRFYRPKK